MKYKRAYMGWKLPDCEERKRVFNPSYSHWICLMSVDSDDIHECGKMCRSGRCPKGLFEKLERGE